jgi:demethylmenaquinone methyltransferase/2-methoxy-6-polyprenyl-1,4-benzoquinol methylase
MHAGSVRYPEACGSPDQVGAPVHPDRVGLEALRCTLEACATRTPPPPSRWRRCAGMATVRTMPPPATPPLADRTQPETIRAVFAGIAARYDLANHVLSCGLDFRWRALAARQVRDWAPSDVLDLATGSGDLALAIQRTCPQAKVTGADFCEPMLERARSKGVREVVVADGTQLPFADGAFDVVTVAFGLRNMADYPQAIREMARVLRPGGHALILDFALPGHPLLRGPYRFYLHRVLPLLAQWVTGDRDAYRYLGGSIEQFPSGAAMEMLICANGFESATTRPLTGGVVAMYTAQRQSLPS